MQLTAQFICIWGNKPSSRKCLTPPGLSRNKIGQIELTSEERWRGKALAWSRGHMAASISKPH